MKMTEQELKEQQEQELEAAIAAEEAAKTEKPKQEKAKKLPVDKLTYARYITLKFAFFAGTKLLCVKTGTPAILRQAPIPILPPGFFGSQAPSKYPTMVLLALLCCFCSSW